MADYFQVKNQNIFNPPANTSLGNATNQFNDVYVQNDLVLGNVTVTGDTIIAPRITTITYPGDDTAADTAGGQTITLTGTGFVAGANLLINGSAVGVVSVVSSTTITFTSPANTTGSYVIYVINPDGSTAIAIPGIQYSGTPTWTTAAGTLGNVYETANFNQTVTATGDAPITYSVVSGSLPPGSTFNANGTITGTSQLSASPTTYSFTVRATDAEQQDTNRAFSIAVIPDVVTWSSPTDNATYSPAANVAIANITLSATSAVGSGITYSANTLPAGLSLTGANISGTPTVSANTSSLLTATANTTTESSSITINWSVSVASDPYFMYNSLLLPGTGTNGAQNNTFLDGSTNNFTITRNGNTTQGTFSPYGPNWSNFFPTTNTGADNLTVANNSALSFTAANDFTVESWIYLTTQNTYSYICSKGNNGAREWGFTVRSSSIEFYWSTNGSSDSSVTSAFSFQLNTWYHVAMSKSGTSVRLFVNGTQQGSTGTFTTIYNGSSPFRIATFMDFTSISHCFAGYISNLRIVKGTAVYTSNFTPSTTPLTAISGTSLLTCQSNRFIDNSSNAFAITVNGTPTIQRFSPFSPTQAYSTSTIGGSGYFDGSGDSLQAPSSASISGTGDFTAECWIYPTTIPGSYNIVGCSDTSGGLTMFGLNSNGTIFMGRSLIDVQATTSNSLSYNTWNHIAISRSSGTVRLFINGIQGYSGSITTNYNAGTVRLGTDGGGSSLPYTGYISNFRIITNSAIYTSNFTPSTTPLTAVSGTSLLLNYTNAGIIDNTMLNNLETVGTAQISTAQTKFGGGSMYFDGAGDYLVSTSLASNILGSGNFTIEFWLYPSNTSSAYRALVSSENYAGTTGGWSLYQNGTGIEFWLSPGGSVTLNATSAITSSTWQHLALCRASGTLRLFINGTSVASVANSTSLTGQQIWIGDNNSGSYFFDGYIDDLRITNGIARYTSNFTPATSALPTY